MPVEGADEPVLIVPYDPAWPGRFDQERAALARTIGEWITGGIHHVGSTSVPGLESKPVIDILVGVRDLHGSRACFDRLFDLGYVYAPYRREEMHWFCKPDPSRRTHHLHLVPVDSARFREELAFRDYLRRNRDVAEEYGALKCQLAERLSGDREAYTVAKAEFIRATVARALNELVYDRGQRAGISISEATFDSHAVQAILTEWNEELEANPEFSRHGGSTVAASDFASPHGVFVLAVEDEEPIGCGGLRRLAPGTGEVKRLYVRRTERGRGIGRALLESLEGHAEALGLRQVRLDTGGDEGVALALFRSANYQPISDYNGNPYARYWFEKQLLTP
jgi:GrpB-like predicted nucleotidyltransferase (UPF0157 family)